jgi:hypothetical protein
MQTDGGAFALIFRHAWVFFILITSVNGGIWWRRAQPEIARNSTLESGYRRLIKSWLIYGNLPWRNGSFVIVFDAVWWRYGRLPSTGCFFVEAPKTSSHPGLLNPSLKDPRAVKILYLLCLVGGIFGLSMMIFETSELHELRPTPFFLQRLGRSHCGSACGPTRKPPSNTM